MYSYSVLLLLCIFVAQYIGGSRKRFLRPPKSACAHAEKYGLVHETKLYALHNTRPSCMQVVICEHVHYIVDRQALV